MCCPGTTAAVGSSDGDAELEFAWRVVYFDCVELYTGIIDEL